MSDKYAFPRYRNCLYHEESGMTLRDYFAAKAMAAYLSQNNGNGRLPVPDYADAAYCMADAMLEARK